MPPRLIDQNPPQSAELDSLGYFSVDWPSSDQPGMPLFLRTQQGQPQ